MPNRIKLSRGVAVFWEYSKEAVAALLLLALASILFGSSSVLSWLYLKRDDLLTAAWGELALGAAVLAIFLCLLATEFGARLLLSGQAKHYIVAFAFPLFAFLAELLGLLFFAGPKNRILAWTCVFLTAYAFVNCITVVTNFLRLLLIWPDVHRARKTGKT